MQATLMAHLNASRQVKTTSGSSESRIATLNAARKGVQHTCSAATQNNTQQQVTLLKLHVHVHVCSSPDAVSCLAPTITVLGIPYGNPKEYYV